MMDSYQQEFLKLALNENNILPTEALIFSNFTLKSGRQSPYFFQSGTFNNGLALQKVGYFFAKTIKQNNLSCDGLFGPAYKGIPLVNSTAIALAEHYGQSYPWSFNRQTAKEHGEGGNIVGAELTGEIIIIDDVLTAGTAVNESIKLIKNESPDAQVCAVVTLLDRCETIENGKSAKTLIHEKYGIPVHSIISIYDILEYLQKQNRQQEIQAIEQHLQQYGER